MFIMFNEEKKRFFPLKNDFLLLGHPVPMCMVSVTEIAMYGCRVNQLLILLNDKRY